MIYEVLAIVEEIPLGTVAAYGRIVRLIGRENNARLVGKILAMSQQYGEYPCHRVVNHTGRTAPGWFKQRILLRQEGVPLKNWMCGFGEISVERSECFQGKEYYLGSADVTQQRGGLAINCCDYDAAMILEHS